MTGKLPYGIYSQVDHPSIHVRRPFYLRFLTCVLHNIIHRIRPRATENEQENRRTTKKKTHLRGLRSTVCGTSSILGRFNPLYVSGLVLRCVLCRLLPALVYLDFHTTATPPVPILLNATRNGSMGRSLYSISPHRRAKHERQRTE